MRITFDRDADAAMIYMEDQIDPAAIVSSEVCDLEANAGALVVDRGSDGRVLSIEFLGASRLLPASFLKLADETDGR